MNIPIIRGRITANTRHDLSRGTPCHLGLIKNISSAIAKEFGIERWMVFSKDTRRFEYIAWPRQIAMYLTAEMTGYGPSQLGQIFGGRCHSTVSYGLSRVRDRLETEPDTKARIQTIKERISHEMPDATRNQQPSKP